MNSLVWALTASLFSLGLAMVVFRRQLLAMLLGVELMLAAVNLAIVHQAGLFSDVDAMAAVAIFIAIAAAESVVGLSLILRVLRSGRGVDASALTELRG
jgi:NADH-quinone oxidoreductase subunit K